MRRRFTSFEWLTAVAFLFLSSVYLLYWTHVEYFLDDWLLMPYFRRAIEGGPAGVADFAVMAAQNRIYDVFRLQWFSILYGFVITWLGGFSAKVNFALLLLLHAVNSWLLCQALRRLGVARATAFLAGTLFLLTPTTRFVLVTYFTNPFFVFSTFWILLMFWMWAREEGLPLLCACAVAGMFSGEQIFPLLWAAIPLAAFCFQRPMSRRRIAVFWTALALAGSLYLLFVNRRPPHQTGVHERYEWRWSTFRNNVSLIFEEMLRLSGLTSTSFFRISPHAVELALAVAAALCAGTLIWRWHNGKPATRLVLFGAAGAVLAYLPTLWIAGGYPLRYHYAASPFLAVAAVAFVKGRLRSTLFGAAMASFLTLNVAAELRQCWIPQSGHLRALKSELARTDAIQPGDIVLISGTLFEIGTAPHFAIHSQQTARPFVEAATGVHPLEVLLDARGEAENQKWNTPRRLSPDELRRAHVLVYSKDDLFLHPKWVAYEVAPRQFRLLPLKGTPPAVERAIFSRDQLTLASRQIYFFP